MDEIQFHVSELRCDPEDNKSEIESYDIYFRGTDGTSLLINIEAGSNFSWSFDTPGKPHNSGSKGK
jgi:hypothetical protein